MRREYVVLTIARMYQISQRVSTLDIDSPDLCCLRDELCAIADAIHNLPRERHADSNNKNLVNDVEIIADLLLSLEEHVLCLHNHLMRQVIISLANYWGIGNDRNIILFVHGDFAVKHYQFLDSLHRNIFELKYKVKLSKEIRVVFIPSLYDNDLLFSSILFHEVGHMVERQYGIGEFIFQKLISLIKSKPNPKIMRMYFDSIINEKGQVEEGKLKCHIGEYVADIFASQYLGEHALHFVTYREGDNGKEERVNHPTCEKREKLVNEFVKYMNSPSHYTDNQLLEMMIEIYANTGEIDNLGKKYIDIDITPIIEGKTISLKTEEELFSLFRSVWNLAVREIKDIESQRHQPDNSLTVNDFYCLLNNGIEQSIGMFYKR